MDTRFGLTTPRVMLAAGLALLLAVTLLSRPPALAQLDSDGTAADDALALSGLLFNSAEHVVIARDDVSIDSLAGGLIQGAVEGPLVLTDTDELSDSAATEIERLGATSATILGGVDAVSQAVEDALVAVGLDVTRLGGATRFGTAEAIFEAEGTDALTGVVARAYPAEGNPTSVFADSIGGGTLGAGFGLPTFLTDTDTLTDTTLEALETSTLEQLLVLGGVDAIADEVVIDLESRGFVVTRLAGDDRAITAAAIAQYIDDAGPGVERVILVDGYLELGWASGFAAAAANLDGTTVVLLSNGDMLPPATAEFLVGGSYDIICGPNTTGTACDLATGNIPEPTPTPTDTPTDTPVEPSGTFTHVGTFDVTTAGSESAEIADVTADGQTLIYSDSPNNAIGFVDIADPSDPQDAGTIAYDGEPTSVAVLGDYLLVALNTSPDFDNPSGELIIADADDGTEIRTIDLGGQPDAIAVSPSGEYAAIAIENERDEDENDGLIPQLPGGFLVVLDATIPDQPNDWTATPVDLDGLAEVAPDDPEVEYVDINDENLAAVSLQENNHLVVVDLATGTVTSDFSAGEVTVEGVDATEEEIGPQENGDIQLTETITKRREPDAVSWIDSDSFSTANEGDYEDADGNEGGSRGFTIWGVDGTVEYDSGNTFEYEQIRAGHYNEGRSENKGGEPEGVETGVYDDGETTFLFVGAERTNVIGVYDVSDGAPTFVQLLPTGSGPEGLKAIGDRDLFVVAAENAEDGFPPLITLYDYDAEDTEPAYPQVASTGEVPVPWVALSGLATGPEGMAAVSDSILGVSYLYDVDPGTSPAAITARTAITGASFSLDAEGVAPAPEGGWWIASEGRYDGAIEERPNALVKIGDDGVVTEEITLPPALVDQATSSGFEGVAVTGEDTSEFLYTVIQREWADDDPGIVKIGRYEVATSTWTFADYELDAVESPAGGWVGLSELTPLPDGTFAVIERDNQLGTDARIKRVYGIDLAAATFAPYDDPRTVVPKTLLVDLLPALEAGSIWTPDKAEGMAISADGNVIVATDNDGLDDAIGQTLWLDLGPLEDL
ncbi:esterase-like activity of phytase family protein [Euzebya tangerina]|uniref:esterase-like activity of phytase family protein n=1 Tax=Euzebya tangerina TaxID=591198 RepID=UPI000E31286D|nr:esterase-like activity of phytase family protein [Euzebya tangerina]